MSSRKRIEALAKKLGMWLETPRSRAEIACASRLLGALADLSELDKRPTSVAMSEQDQLREVAKAIHAGTPVPKGWRARRLFNSAKLRLHTVHCSLRGDQRKIDPRPKLTGSIDALWRAIAWDVNAFKHRDEELDLYVVSATTDALRAAEDAAKRLTTTALPAP